MNAAHTLAEVVEAGWAPSERYLVVRLRRGEIRGRKVGRHWRMSDDDIRSYIESLANQATAPKLDVPSSGLTAASARRHAS
jgi:hypothetical protein